MRFGGRCSHVRRTLIVISLLLAIASTYSYLLVDYLLTLLNAAIWAPWLPTSLFFMFSQSSTSHTIQTRHSISEIQYLAIKRTLGLLRLRGYREEIERCVVFPQHMHTTRARLLTQNLGIKSSLLVLSSQIRYRPALCSSYAPW